MASRILLPRFSPLLAGGLCATSIIAAPLLLRPLYTRRLLCDGPAAKPIINPDWSYTKQAKTPLVKSDGHLNPNALKEISTGSILGLLGGLAVSVFSKPLAVVLGLLVIGVQVLESRDIHIVPYNRLQSMFTGWDVRSAIQDNVAFKLSFGATFALAAFAEF